MLPNLDGTQNYRNRNKNKSEDLAPSLAAAWPRTFSKFGAVCAQFCRLTSGSCVQDSDNTQRTAEHIIRDEKVVHENIIPRPPPTRARANAYVLPRTSANEFDKKNMVKKNT